MKTKPWQLKLFYLILFLIPCNLAKHFILPSSYVNGILVDYLIPTLYLTDILIIVLLSSELQKGLRTLKGYELSDVKKFVTFLCFLFFLLPSVIFAASPIPAIYKYLKILLLILFSLWIKKNINLKKQFTPIINTLSASVLFQSLLALTQWFKQSSVLNYWFLGEQPFNSAIPGIDKITWFTGAIKIPPMGTFPHPNILAGFLAIVLPLILHQLSSKLQSPLVRNFQMFQSSEPWSFQKVPNLLYFISLLLGLITLFLTFSLSAWLAFLLIGLPLTIFSYFKKSVRPIKFIFIYFGLFLILFSFATKFTFLAPASSFSRRSQLSKIAVKMIKDHPFIGVGFNNFTLKMEQYGHVTSTSRFLQPVHNIYLLILSETGIIGFLGFLYLLGSIGYELSKKFVTSSQKTPNPLQIPLLSLLFLGLFDHYPLTIHQGLLLFFTFLAL